MRTYSIEIDPAEWQSIEAEFNDLAALAGTATTSPPNIRSCFTWIRRRSPTPPCKLHGQSSWLQTVMFDGARAKMQFDVAFDEIDPNGKFHGVDKLVFDMPRVGLDVHARSARARVAAAERHPGRLRGQRAR